jgi:hypothetical protein
MTSRKMLHLLLAIVLLACQATSILVPVGPQAIPTVTIPPTPRATATPTPTKVPRPVHPAILPLPGAPFVVRVHPDGGLFAGDQVSFEVISPPGSDLNGLKVQVSLADQPESLLAASEFAGFGISGRQQATLSWAWGTRDLQPGDYKLRFSVVPNGPAWEQSFTLLPAKLLQSPEPNAIWAQAESDCCILHYITGTEAERDLAGLLRMADEQAADVSERMGANFSKKIPVTILSRVLGHGGFTSKEIAISYLDRNYAGGSQAIVLHHEMVHWLDGQLGGDVRPSLFVEGLAVYLSGGHFKPEDLPPRAAALLELDGYLPLTTLADNFYPSQHESGYIEAGALVQYMVERWSWESFQSFYRDIHTDPNGGGPSGAIDAALRAHFRLSFDELEADFLDYLRAQTAPPEILQDVRLSVAFYDTLRRYQLLLDPSAHYLTAWLPDGQRLRELGIVADYLRRPASPLNVSIETLLLMANMHLEAGEYTQTASLLAAINLSLDSLSK